MVRYHWVFVDRLPLQSSSGRIASMTATLAGCWEEDPTLYHAARTSSEQSVRSYARAHVARKPSFHPSLHHHQPLCVLGRSWLSMTPWSTCVYWKPCGQFQLTQAPDSNSSWWPGARPSWRWRHARAYSYSFSNYDGPLLSQLCSCWELLHYLCGACVEMTRCCHCACGVVFRWKWSTHPRGR